MPITAGNCMDDAASLLNDTAKATYTYSLQLPYFRMAYAILENKTRLNGLPLVNEVASPATITALATTYGTLPADLVTPVNLWERASGSSDLYTPMVERIWEPEEEQVEALRYWVWREQDIKFLGATTARQVKLEYKKFLTTITDQNSNIEFAGGRIFLAFKTAALVAKYVMQMHDRAMALEGEAQDALNDFLNDHVKGRQNIRVRRQRYRSRGR